MKREASFEVKDASTDDYFLAVASAYKVNVILDATQVPQNGPRVTRKYENFKLWGSVPFFASRNGINGLSWGDDNTFLLWQQPDMAQLARDLVAKNEIKVAPADTPPFIRLVMHQDTLGTQLSAFFRDKKGWDGERPFQATASLEELPDELRARLTVQTRGTAWNLMESKVSPQWFSGNFWKNTRLRFIEGRDAKTGAARSELALTGVVQRSADGTTVEECVYLSQPAMPFRVTHTARAGVRNAAATPNNDTVLAQSSLAAPYQPVMARLNLAADAALSPKVTLVLKRQPLSEVIRALGEKAGVKLSLSPELTAKATLLTMGLNEMPLHDAMAALTRLSGIEWRQAAGGYSAGPSRGTALDLQLLQARENTPMMLRAEAPANDARKAQESQEWTTKIRLAVGQAALATPTGAAFSDLPDDVQAELRERVQAHLAPVLVDSQSQLREKAEALNGVWRIELDVPAEKSKRGTIVTTGQVIEVKTPVLVRVRAQSGQFLASVLLKDAD